MRTDSCAVETLIVMLEGSEFSNALRNSGKPCRACLPDDPAHRRALVDAHIHGESGVLTFVADGCDPWTERVDAVVLASICPGSDGLCRWIGIDLDADDHGERGLANPSHSARVIAERADNAGLGSGLLVAHSRRGRGRHLFLFPPEPAQLEDAVVAVAALTASAFRVAAEDVLDCDALHGFRRANGTIASPGDPGAVELYPRSTTRPPYGWSIALPANGAARAHGGGVILDPIGDKPIELGAIPKCTPNAWSAFVAEARAALDERATQQAPRCRHRPAKHRPLQAPIDRIDSRSRAFIEGSVQDGNRNNAAFAASANLLGCGIDSNEAERLILEGAASCGLPEREAKNAFQSALKSLNRSRRLE